MQLTNEARIVTVAAAWIINLVLVLPRASDVAASFAGNLVEFPHTVTDVDEWGKRPTRARLGARVHSILFLRKSQFRVKTEKIKENEIIKQ